MDKVEAKGKQHESWTLVAPGWGKYDPLMRTWAAPVTERMIALAAIREASRVLDIACGAGEPALTVAEKVGAEIGTFYFSGDDDQWISSAQSGICRTIGSEAMSKAKKSKPYRSHDEATA